MSRPRNDDPNNLNDLNASFAAWRREPCSPDPDAISAGFEARVLARLREHQRSAPMVWFWRWAGIFTVAAAVFTTLTFQSFDAMLDDSLAALESNGPLSDWAD